MVLATAVVTVTPAVLRVRLSVPASPKVTLPADVKRRPSRVTLPSNVVAVSPAVMVTLSLNVTSAALVIPLAVASVLLNVVVPLVIVIAAPVPSPMGVTLPTAALKAVTPVPCVAKVRSRAPSTKPLKVMLPLLAVVLTLTSPLERVT